MYNSASKNNPKLISESIALVQLGLYNQKSNKQDKAKEYFQQAIDKISKALLTSEEDNKKGKFRKKKDIILECYSLYERIKNNNILKNVSINSQGIGMSMHSKQTKCSSIIDKVNNEKKLVNKNKSIYECISGLIDKGDELTYKLFIRKEIWNQTSAKIQFLSQKYEGINLLYNKIDGLMTLVDKKVINFSNFDRFIDIIIDIQNSFSKELQYVKSVNLQPSKEIQANSFHKKFTDFSAKIKNSFMTSKLEDKPDYFDLVKKLSNKIPDMEKIYLFLEQSVDNKDSLNKKVLVLNKFLYQCLFKLIIVDLQDLTMRFLKKKIISFEEK